MNPGNTRELLRRALDENDPHCPECKCQDCRFFVLNGGDCIDACKECDHESHISFCPMFSEVEA